jgi:hypothetical protein
MDITKLITLVADEYGGDRPSPRELRAFVVDVIGPEVGIGIASLLWGIWVYLFPREAKSQSPTCQWRLVPAARKCGAAIVHSEFLDQGRVLRMTCVHGHRVKKAVKSQ